ncbi:hypothetical protein ACFWN2_32810 [Lentzea sp. NPDC058436]|uniref:hypothetical protein n=1 Tax=Lentzea sp. NPDC058436 TaxID=3346499 RepID=UPI0036691F2A
MGRFFVALALMLGFAVLSAPLALASPGSRWEVVPCASGTKALWLPREVGAGTDLSCTTEEARSAAVKAARDSRSPTRLLNVAIAYSQQLADKSITPDSSCVLGARGAVGEAIGTCVASG